MGLAVVKPVVQVRGVRVDVVKAVPDYSYVPFPAYRTKSPGDLITQFKALPSAVTVDDLYWWTDCQFVPYDDSQLLTTSGAYHLRHNQSSVRELKIPLGKICRFRLGPPKIKCEIFGKASTFTYPRLQIYPDGCSVAYLGTGDIKILSFESNTVTSKAQNLHFHSYRTCVLSCDGKKFAIMARTGIHTYDILIYHTEILTIPDCIIDLHKMNPGFKKNRTNTEHPECKWSVDCKCVAAGLSTGPLLVVNVKCRSMLCNVFPDVIPDNSLSRETAFDFDPMSLHQLMAVGTSDRYLYIINVEMGKILCRTAEVCGSDSIDVVKFSPNGRFVGVALHNCQIQLYHPDDCSLLYRFSMKDHSTELAGWSPGPCPVVIHMNFSMTGQQAVTSTADGMIRVWQLPPNLCLQYLCKMKILSLISQDKVKRLPLPGQIMDYLLTMPTKE